jgi:hypothetical protein
MHGSRRKISSKNLVKQRCAEGFNSGVKWLNIALLAFIQLLKYLNKNNAIRIFSNLDLEIFQCISDLNITYTL